MLHTRLSIALLIIRVSVAGFFGVWSSLKFYRPEWFENVFRNFYGLEFASRDMSAAVGVVQLLIVLAFVLGYKRTISYTLIALMQAAGVAGSIPNLISYTQYPNNLMWAAVPALGATIALILLRDNDGFTIDGVRSSKSSSEEIARQS